jgi:hypothetical protein
VTGLFAATLIYYPQQFMIVLHHDIGKINLKGLIFGCSVVWELLVLYQTVLGRGTAEHPGRPPRGQATGWQCSESKQPRLLVLEGPQAQGGPGATTGSDCCDNWRVTSA